MCSIHPYKQSAFNSYYFNLDPYVHLSSPAGQFVQESYPPHNILVLHISNEASMHLKHRTTWVSAIPPQAVKATVPLSQAKSPKKEREHTKNKWCHCYRFGVISPYQIRQCFHVCRLCHKVIHVNLVLFIYERGCSVDETDQHVMIKYHVMKIWSTKWKDAKKTPHVTAVDRNSKNMMSESDKTSEEYEEWCMSP